MKNIIAIHLVLLLCGCVSVFKTYEGHSVRVIKFERFGKIEWDFCLSVGTAGDRAFYVKEDLVLKTNYIKGDFQVLTYADYLRERKK